MKLKKIHERIYCTEPMQKYDQPSIGNPSGDLLFPPLLMGNDGKQMSKSLGNLCEYGFSELVDKCRGCDENYI